MTFANGMQLTVANSPLDETILNLRWIAGNSCNVKTG
jgi:hypothetical protein